MTNEQILKFAKALLDYPLAKHAERFVRALETVKITKCESNGGFKKIHYTIHPLKQSMYIGCGDTKAQAWKDAKDTLVERFKNFYEQQQNEQHNGN